MQTKTAHYNRSAVSKRFSLTVFATWASKFADWLQGKEKYSSQSNLLHAIHRYTSPGYPDYVDYVRFSDDIESIFTVKSKCLSFFLCLLIFAYEAFLTLCFNNIQYSWLA